MHLFKLFLVGKYAPVSQNVCESCKYIVQIIYQPQKSSKYNILFKIRTREYGNSYLKLRSKQHHQQGFF